MKLHVLIVCVIIELIVHSRATTVDTTTTVPAVPLRNYAYKEDISNDMTRIFGAHQSSGEYEECHGGHGGDTDTRRSGGGNREEGRDDGNLDPETPGSGEGRKEPQPASGGEEQGRVSPDPQVDTSEQTTKAYQKQETSRIKRSQQQSSRSDQRGPPKPDGSGENKGQSGKVTLHVKTREMPGGESFLHNIVKTQINYGSRKQTSEDQVQSLLTKQSVEKHQELGTNTEKQDKEVNSSSLIRQVGNERDGEFIFKRDDEGLDGAERRTQVAGDLKGERSENINNKDRSSDISRSGEVSKKTILDVNEGDSEEEEKAHEAEEEAHKAEEMVHEAEEEAHKAEEGVEKDVEETVKGSGKETERYTGGSSERHEHRRREERYREERERLRERRERDREYEERRRERRERERERRERRREEELERERSRDRYRNRDYLYSKANSGRDVFVRKDGSRMNIFEFLTSFVRK